MKRTGYLFEKITDLENIKSAIRNASKGKRNRRNVKTVLDNIDEYALKIRNILINKIYNPHEAENEVIFDKSSLKERTIFKPKYYPDQIIHWALMLVLEPVITKGMYDYCCGSVPKRGIHFALKAVKSWLANDRKHTKYCYKIDISKFYPSVDKEILKAQFRRKIKDQDTLWLIDKIVDAHGQGLPIGNFTSQWFSNFYLEGFDHYVKEDLKIKYYIRYADDCCMFSNNKKDLHRKRKLIERYLSEELHLKVKNNWQLFKVDSRGVDFVGYRIFRDYVLLRNKTALKMSRKARRVMKKGTNMSLKDAQSIISYNGWLKHCNSHNFAMKYFYPLNIKNIKGVISHEGKLNSKAE